MNIRILKPKNVTIMQLSMNLRRILVLVFIGDMASWNSQGRKRGNRQRGQYPSSLVALGFGGQEEVIHRKMCKQVQPTQYLQSKSCFLGAILGKNRSWSTFFCEPTLELTNVFIMYAPSLPWACPSRNQKHKVVELLDGRLSWKCLVDCIFLKSKNRKKNTGCVQCPATKRKLRT